MDSLDIKIVTTGDASGAAQVDKALEEVKQTAQEAGDSIQNGLGKLGKGVSEVKPAVEGFKQDAEALRNESRAAGDEVAAAIPKFSRLKEGVEGLNMALRGGPGAAFGLSKALDALLGSFSRIAAAAASLGASIAAGFSVGNLLYKAIIDPIWSAIERANTLTSEFAVETARKLKALEELKVEFKGINDEIAATGERFDAMISRMKSAQAGRGDIAQAKDTLAMRKLDAAEKREISGANGNKDLEAAIKARYDEERAKVEIAAAERKVNEDIAQAKMELRLKSEQLNRYEQAWAKSAGLAADEVNKYLEAVRVLNRYGVDHRSLISDPAGRQRAVDEARSRLDKSEAVEKTNPAWKAQTGNDRELYVALTNFSVYLKDAASSSQKNDEIQKALIQKMGDTSRDIMGIQAKLEALTTQKDVVAEEKSIKAFELGADSKQAFNGLEQAVREQTAKVMAAREQVSNAQAYGNMADQNSAQGRLVREESLLQSLSMQLESARERVKQSGQYFGQSYTEAASIVSTSSEEAEASIANSAQSLSDVSKKAADDIHAGASVVTSAATEAQQNVAGALGGLGTAISGFGAEIVDIVESIRADVSAASNLAAQANDKSDRALSQIRNGR